MTTYRGFDVLEVEPDWPDDRKTTYSRKLSRIDNGMAPVQTRDIGGRNFGGSAYQWWCGSRADVQDLRNFLDARRGQSVPFWVPTWAQDFTLSQPASSADQGVVVSWRGYTDHVFPDAARRDIAIILPSGMVYRRITGVSQATATETLTLSSSLGVVVPVGSLICFLTLCRLNNDAPEIIFENSNGVATCDLGFTEIPAEVPA